MHSAHERLQSIYDHGSQLLALDDCDPIRYQLQIDKITSDARQLLNDMSTAAPLQGWAQQAAALFNVQGRALNSAVEFSEEQYV